MRAARLIVFGLIATVGALIERPAGADIVVGDETTPLPAAVCLDVPLVNDLHIGLGLGVPVPCPRPVIAAPAPSTPLPAPVPTPSAVVPKPVVRSIAAPPAVEATPVAAPPTTAPTEPALPRAIRSHRPAAPTPPPNPLGSTVGLVAVAAAVAGGTNVLFRSR